MCSKQNRRVQFKKLNWAQNKVKRAKKNIILYLGEGIAHASWWRCLKPSWWWGEYCSLLWFRRKLELMQNPVWWDQRSERKCWPTFLRCFHFGCFDSIMFVNVQRKVLNIIFLDMRNICKLTIFMSKMG